MAPFETVQYDGRALRVPEAETLVLADVHLGRVRRSRVDLPLGEGQDFLDRLQSLLEAHEPARVVIAGDLVHAFDSLPFGVAETVTDVIERVHGAGAELVVTAGNHDTTLEGSTSIDPVSEFRLDPDTVVHHGHERPDSTVDRYIVGHEHPAITVEGTRQPCFLRCRNQYEGTAVLILPAFSRVAIGSSVNDLSADDMMSPLVTDMDDCRPVIPTDNGPLHFPPLEELRPHL